LADDSGKFVLFLLRLLIHEIECKKLACFFVILGCRSGFFLIGLCFCPVGGIRCLMEGAPVFDPGSAPILGLSQFELRINFFRGIDPEVVGKKIGRALVNKKAPVKNRHRVVELKVGEAVSDAKDKSPVLARKAVKEAHDVVLRLRVQAARDFVAEENLRPACQFDRQREAPALTTGENAHTTLREFQHSDFLEDEFQILLGIIRVFASKSHGKIHALPHGELLVGDAELRDISYLTR